MKSYVVQVELLCWVAPSWAALGVKFVVGLNTFLPPLPESKPNWLAAFSTSSLSSILECYYQRLYECMHDN